MSHEKKSEKEKVDILKKGIEDGKHVFLLIFMTGCGPCNETKPKWYKFEEKYGDNNKAVVIDIEQASIDQVKDLIGESPGGFPCMRHIHNGKVEDYEKCDKLDKTNLRTLESFEDWFKIKTGGGQNGGRRAKKQTKRRRNKRGGKWSLKYKRSINCRHPKGFSQRQHCKYGRKHK
jgi:thiol-disulfide isomerase/thioredoxin